MYLNRKTANAFPGGWETCNETLLNKEKGRNKRGLSRFS